MDSDSVKRMFESGLMFVQTKASTVHGLEAMDEAKGILKFMSTLEYNGFDGKKVANCLEHLIKQGFVSGFAFGREYSPVLYVTVSPVGKDYKVQSNKVLLARTRHVIESLRDDTQPDELWGTPPHSSTDPKHGLDKNGEWVTSRASIEQKIVLQDKGEIRAWWD